MSDVIAPVPVLMTIRDLPSNLLKLFKDHGYDGITYQAQNSDTWRDFDLTPACAVRLSPGVWGVTYSAADFFRDGKILGSQAVRLGAEHVTMDIEFAAKFTRANRGLMPVIDGIRAGGWMHAVNLNTMGPPVNHMVNDYEIDLQSFLDTGGGIFTQCYANENDWFTPQNGMEYFMRVGVPADRINITISLYPAEADKQYPGRKYTGADYVPLLQAAGVKRNLSIFMAEIMDDADLSALDTFTKTVEPEPPQPTVPENREAMLQAAQGSIAIWRSKQKPEVDIQLERQTLAWRALNVEPAYRQGLQSYLDSIGAPRP